MKHNKKALIVSIILAITGVASAVYLYQYTHTAKLEKQYIQTKAELNSKVDALNNTKTQLDSTETDKANLQKQVEELNKVKNDLEAQLQAKLAEKQRLASIAPKQAQASSVQPTVQVSGTCADWIAQAGISDVASAQELIRRESGCNPNAVNRSSGACGIAQELPCGKSGCSLGDGACQIRWMNSYVLGRYKSWANAIAWHNSHNWY